MVAATVIVVAGIAAWTWFQYLPNHRPDLPPGERYGVDVSWHQGHIDWNAVAHDDIDFA